MANSRVEKMQEETNDLMKQIHKIREEIDDIIFSRQNIKNSHFESSWMHYCDDADPDVPYRLNHEMLEEAKRSVTEKE